MTDDLNTEHIEHTDIVPIADPAPDDMVNIHHTTIRDLALQLRGASPSAAETISDKIIAALDAIHDPESWHAEQDALQAEEDARESERKAVREKRAAEQAV